MALPLSTAEAHRRITEYLARFSDAVSSQDGSALKPLLAVSSNSPYLLSIADTLDVFQDSSRLVNQTDKYSRLGEILIPHFRCLQSFQIERFVDACIAFEKAANAFLLEFRKWETGWAMEAMHTVALEIRVLAERADGELALSGKNLEKLLGAGSFLMKVFGALASIHLVKEFQKEHHRIMASC
ncbi:putative Enhanced ethylene response protein 5 [Cocos nucifera]|uniref:Putative Enhanced ethylene response protein 5 n=1 Tax=Cocos nucifera TaxID=13894 RepID=A0A8K0I0Q0_COCNU|nr:putative Enhanced ethylene response protein 5 [Cocos nucifera]